VDDAQFLDGDEATFQGNVAADPGAYSEGTEALFQASQTEDGGQFADGGAGATKYRMRGKRVSNGDPVAWVSTGVDSTGAESGFAGDITDIVHLGKV
jgi:hypothetical protein